MEPYFETLFMPDERFRIKSFFSSQFEHVVAVNPHWHPEVEILYIESGCAVQQVNEHYFTTEAGDIIIIGKDQLHSTYSYRNSQCRILVLQLDSSGMLKRKVLGEDDDSDDIFVYGSIFKNPIKTDGVAGYHLKEIILELHHELCSRQDGFKPIVRSLVYRLVGVLSRNEMFSVENGNGKDLRLTRQVLGKTFNLIDKNYCDDLSLKDAASASNLSTPHFCRLFKKATGMTFNTYLSFYRVNRAEKMLYSDRTLSSVAMECGFGSMSSFIRNFKKYKNCTPSAYKKL